MGNELSFEQPLEELKSKIEELRKFGVEKQMDFSDEIARLQERYQSLEKELYSALTPVQKMQIARHPSRPSTLDYIPLIFQDFIEFHGDRMFRDDLAIVGGIGRLNGMAVTVVGHQKGRDTKDNIVRNFGMPHPEGLRKGLRLMQQAEKFRRPIITFIDTAGAFPGGAAEERGQGEAIARNLMAMSTFRVPVICVVIGEGGSGGALALGVGNRVFMLENAIYSVISPNSAAAILWKDASKADQAAETMKITAQDLLRLQVIDGIIEEPQGGAHRNLEQTASAISEVLIEQLQQLLTMSEVELQQDRYRKFRQIGTFTYLDVASPDPL